MPAPNIIGWTKEGRAIVYNGDGTVSTERTTTIQHPMLNQGQWTNIPTMFGGIEFPQEAAIQYIVKFKGMDPDTGLPVQGFPSLQEAEKSAQSRSKLLGQEVSPILQKYMQSLGPLGEK